MKTALCAVVLAAVACSGDGEGGRSGAMPWLGTEPTPADEPRPPGGAGQAAGAGETAGKARADEPVGASAAAVAENLPPELLGFAAESAIVEASGSTALTVRVLDPEADPVDVWWDSSCGIVSATAGDPTRAIFLAPHKPGACTVTVQLQEVGRRRTVEYAYQLKIVPSVGMEVVDEVP